MENFDLDDYLRIADLISQYLKGSLSKVNAKELSDWCEADQANRDLFDAIVDEQQLERAYSDFKAFDVEKAFVNVNSKLIPRKASTFKLYKKWFLPVAASVLLCLSAGGYWLAVHNHQQHTVASQDIGPGRNQATLTLANGQKIVLTKGLNGTLSKLGNTLVTVNAGNSINYSNSNSEITPAQTGYNILSTQNGEQSPYPLILSDGTKVWLNAASSITFPTSFAGKDRAVTITGEAYLEVIHSKAHPFFVHVKGQTICDIGTSFNINAYDDEPYIKTTLITGKIAIIKNGHAVALLPGQQAQTGTSGGTQILNHTDLEEVLAWKNGLFKFDHADIKSIMRQLARWYNVDIAYEGVIPGDDISGKIYKNVSAANALEILNSLNIHFRIDNDHGMKKIIVTP